MNGNENRYLGEEPVGSLMQKYAIPCIISLLVGALYNIVDQIFIANASYLGSYGNAANTVVFPLTVIALAIVIVELFPGALIGIFGAANESAYYTAFAIKAFRVYLCMMIFACVNKACFIFLQAMGKAMEATVLSMVREIVFGVGFALLLPLKFGLDGVLYSMPLSDILTFLIALFLIIQTYRELRKEKTGRTVLSADRAKNYA